MDPIDTPSIFNTPEVPHDAGQAAEPVHDAPAPSPSAGVSPAEDDGPLFGIGSIVGHPTFGKGRIIGFEGQSYVIAFMSGEVKRLAFNFELKCEDPIGDPALDLMKMAMREVLGEHGWIDCEIEMGTRWQGGSLILKPGKANAQEKEIPLDVFFKKLISVREKLRVLEQKINNHPSLNSQEKVDLQAYITRSYGSLTSFNTLFKSKEQGFVGQSTKDD
jgi:hypothetical protein